jgi:hypothetical protein
MEAGSLKPKDAMTETLPSMRIAVSASGSHDCRAPIRLTPFGGHPGMDLLKSFSGIHVAFAPVLAIDTDRETDLSKHFLASGRGCLLRRRAEGHSAGHPFSQNSHS